MLRRAAFRPKRTTERRKDDKRCPPYLKWLRGRECVVGHQCSGRTEAAHVGGVAEGKGVSTKCIDAYALPLCAAHHAEQHQAGIKTFEARHNVNLLKLADEFWTHWLYQTPMGRAWMEKQDG